MKLSPGKWLQPEIENADSSSGPKGVFPGNRPSSPLPPWVMHNSCLPVFLPTTIHLRILFSASLKAAINRFSIKWELCNLIVIWLLFFAFLTHFLPGCCLASLFKISYLWEALQMYPFASDNPTPLVTDPVSPTLIIFWIFIKLSGSSVATELPILLLISHSGQGVNFKHFHQSSQHMLYFTTNLQSNATAPLDRGLECHSNLSPALLRIPA